jgi:HlyD family secretion protein
MTMKPPPNQNQTRPLTVRFVPPRRVLIPVARSAIMAPAASPLPPESPARNTRAPQASPHRGPIFIGLILICVALGSGCGKRGGTLAKYETVPAARGELVEHVTASGTLGAVVSVDVGSQVSGKISALYADFNSPVRKGQLVAEIDPVVYQAALKQAEGDLASAQATAKLKQQNLERKKILVPLKAASQLDLDQAVAELAEAEATVTIKDAMLQSAQANLDYCKITAPVDGIIISRKVDQGQTVIAAMTTPVLFTVAQDIAKMNISATISEADIGQVKDGQAVEFTVDAFPDDVFKGTVTQVRKAPTTTQNVVTYETIIGFDNPGQKLFPGMTADVSVLVADHQNALKIPNAALRYAPPDDAEYEQTAPKKLARNERLIYAAAAGGMKLRPVVIKAGITDGADTEVLDGLTDGEPVVIATLATPTSGGFGPPPPPQQTP